MLFVVRHGERGDYAGPEEQKKIQLPFDPHLTDLGKIQARKAGDKIIKLVQDHCKESDSQVDQLQYLIISSPFRRCIQTAFHISQALPKEKIWGNKIYLNDFLSEHLDGLYFEKNVLPDLQVRTDLEEVKKHVEMEIQDGFPEIGDHFSTPIYPEGATIHKRVPAGYTKLKPLYLKELNKDKNLVVILVSHGYVVEVFLEMHEALDRKKGVEYTSLAFYTVEDGDKKGKALVAQCHEQLEEAEAEYKKLLGY